MPAYAFKDRRVAEGLKRDFYHRHEPFNLFLPQNRPRTAEIIRVFNEASETAPKGGCLKVLGEEEVTKEGLVCSFDKPDAVFQLRYLVALHEIEDQKYGWATYLYEADWILRDATGTPLPGQMWGPNAGEWKVFKDCPGFLASGGTLTEDGSVYLRATQQFPAVVYGEADGDILEDATTGTVKVRKALGTGLTGQTIEDCTNLSVDIDNMKPVTVAFPNGLPLVAGLKCPVA
jgi:hypothetical protein